MTWAKRAGWTLALLGGVLLVVWGGRLVQTGLALRAHLRQVQALVDAPAAVDLVAACGLVQDLRGDVTDFSRQAGGLIRLAPALGGLPGIGGDLRAAPHLLAVANGLTGAGTAVCDALQPPAVLAAFEGTGAVSSRLSLQRMTRLLAEERDDLERALAAAGQAQEAWAQVDVERLSPRLAGNVALLEQSLPLLQSGLELAMAAPDLLGMDGPRTYLILAQNDDELRPTGGFISGVGRLTLDGGRIAELSFLDTYRVDDYKHKPYPEPPEPLLHYMGSELWLFRDANWSPDFPTSARQAAYLYEYGQGVPVHGVVALDQRAVELLMPGLGEVQVPGMAEPVTAANVRQFMRQAWNPGDAGVTAEWLRTHKEFIGNLAAAIRQRVEENPRSVDWVQVARGLYRALEGRHLLVYVDDADATRALARVGWDGALRESAGDYLMVVDANLGFGKVNSLVDERLVYRVTLYADGTAAAELALRYAHRGARENVRCQHPLVYGGGTTYEAIMHRCYYDYLRVYVPGGSVLRAATSHPTPAAYLLRGEPDDGRAVTLGDEAGKAVFAQFFVVEYGRTLTTRLVYDLPRVVWPDEDHWRYALLVQKQAGTGSIPLTLTVVLPPGAGLVAAEPSPRSVDGEELTFDLALDTDVVVELAYK